MLTEIQKEIVNQILNRKTVDFSSFLFENKLTDYKSKEEIDKVLFTFSTGYATDTLGLLNFNESFDKIINYISILEMLEKYNLIFTYKILYNLDIKFYPNGRFNGDNILIDKLNYFFKGREIIEFIPLKELDEFVKRGYLTEEEYYKREEDKDRKAALMQAKISQRWTVGISLGIFYLVQL